MTQPSRDSAAPVRHLVFFLLIVGLAASLLYDFGWQWGLGQPLRNVLGIISFSILMGSSALVMVLATWLGTGFWRGVLWAMVIPALWLLKEAVNVHDLHGLEGLTFSLQRTAFLGYAGLVFAAMTAATLPALFVTRFAGRPTPGLYWYLLLPVFTAASFWLAWRAIQSYGAPS